LVDMCERLFLRAADRKTDRTGLGIWAQSIAAQSLGKPGS
jgi:hypothetical protein